MVNSVPGALEDALALTQLLAKMKKYQEATSHALRSLVWVCRRADSQPVSLKAKQRRSFPWLVSSCCWRRPWLRPSA